MGKNKNKKKQESAAAAAKVAEQAAPAEEQKSMEAGPEMNNQEEVKPTEPEVPQKSAEERAEDYKKSALEIHAKYCSQWGDEEERLDEDMDLTEGNKILEKKTNDEKKTLEKIMKKETNEFEDLTGTGASNVKMVYDKLLRTLKNSRSVTKEANKICREAKDIEEAIIESKLSIQKNIKNKKMLNMICDTFLNQNFELYK